MVASNQDHQGASSADPQIQAVPCGLIRSSEPRQTLLQVHTEATARASDMFEATLMCLHVLGRLMAIIRQVEQSKLHTSLQAINRFSSILRNYFEFLKKFANQKAAFRLVYNRTVVNQNLKFHDDIDNLLRGLNIPDDNWRQQWGEYCDAQQAAFEAMSGNRMALIGDLRDAQAQTEALSLLMFEFNKVNSKYTQKELKVLNNAFSIVSTFSNSKTPTIATWFLPPYEFECEELPFAWGAFGTVHHGKHCGSDVVVKRAKISSDADRALFVKEANTWFSANQIPNVVRLFGAYHVGTTPYFVCEYAANGTLGDYLFKEENRLKTWKLLHEAALGLRGIHRLKIVHNDLKCNNILVASDGIAKITDFGLSSQLSVQESQSVSKAVGAFSWKAPEVIAGTAHPSYASDVYSFAMCIYEAVSHRVPWAGVDNAMIWHNVKECILPKRPEGFTDDQWDLIEAMCALKPEDRLSMDDVIERLRRFAGEEYNSIDVPSTSAFSAIRTQYSDDGVAGGSIPVIGMTSMPSTPAGEYSGIESSSPRSSECKLLPPISASPRNISKTGIATLEQTIKLPTVPLLSNDRGPSTEDDDQSDASRETSEPGAAGVVAVVVTPPPPSDDAAIKSLSISGHRTKVDNGRCIEYEISILAGEKMFKVWKRYSDFRYLHQHFLRESRPEMDRLSCFPSRKPFSKPTSTRVIDQRKKGLDAFLKEILRNNQLQLGIDVGNERTLFKEGGSSNIVF